ncbi:MAG: transglutaminase domain-containing protein [bacterium]
MSIENPQEQIGAPESGQPKKQNIIERMYEKTLTDESFENVAEALDGVDALRNFRKNLCNTPFGSFHEIIEEMTNINKARLSKEEKDERVKGLTAVMEEKAVCLSPRVADLYTRILFGIKGESYEPKYEITSKKMTELIEKDDLRILFSPDASWDMKLNRIETRLTDYLLGTRALDKREGKEMDDDIRKWREEELKKALTQPPERKNESKPGVDPMERLKEGERAPAIWSINPGFDSAKYFKEQSFSEWDSKRNVWTEKKYYSDAKISPFCEKEDMRIGLVNLTMRAKIVTGKWIGLAVPYTHALHKAKAGSKDVLVKQDQNGDLVLFVKGNGENVELNVILGPYPEKKFTSAQADVKVPEMPAEFSKETDVKLEEIKSKERSNIKRAHALASYVRSSVKYLSPKDSAEADYYNNFYRTHKNAFAGAVDEIKEADCDVANTYFAALCARLNIPVRHCVGHSVKGRDANGASSINSVTGHGWSEIWDEVKKEWTRVDATPAGDPNLEEDEEKAKTRQKDFIPGDDIEQEAITPSDEKIEKLRKKLAERKEQLSYTKEERELSEHAGVELKEARQIVKEINEAEQTRLPNNEKVTDALSRLFNAIVESRKHAASAYTGPVRQREGGEAIEYIVRHKIGMLSWDTDPMSREKPTEEIKEEKIIGGFDLYIIGDKSGSMSSTVEDEALWKMQRRAEYLIFSALHRFEKNLERAGLQKDNTLSVRTQGISFRGSKEDDIDLDKWLSAEFSAKDKVKMWHSLTGASGGNGDSEALGVIYEQIKEEIKENEKRGVKDKRLRLVIACSDGGYVGDDDVKMHKLAEELGKLNAVVVGIGLTSAAANVKEVMTTDYSRGDIARDINDLPALVAKHLILEAIKLFPEKAKESVKQIIENSLDKFKNIK